LNPRNFKGKNYVIGEIAIALSQPSGNNQTLLVYTPTNSTSTQPKSMKRTMARGGLQKNATQMEEQSPTLTEAMGQGGGHIPIVWTQETSEQSKQKKSPTTTSLPQDFHAKVLALLENGKGLMTQGGLFSSTSPGYLKLKTQDYSFLRMLKDCYLTTLEALSKPSSPRLQNWGMTSNGKCLTARISVSPRTENGCSLSDILEEQVDPKYFLSEYAMSKMKLKGLDTWRGSEDTTKPMMKQG